jgi:hypothetical protein
VISNSSVANINHFQISLLVRSDAMSFKAVDILFILVKFSKLAVDTCVKSLSVRG